MSVGLLLSISVGFKYKMKILTQQHCQIMRYISLFILFDLIWDEFDQVSS